MTIEHLVTLIEQVEDAQREDERVAQLDPLERRLETAMQRAFREQERRFMRGFEGLRSQWPEPIREAVEPRDWEPLFSSAELATLSLFRDPLTGVIREALDVGARRAIADVGVEMDFDLENPRAVQYIEQAPIKVSNVNDATRGEIRRIITQGIEQGASFDRTAAELQSKWESFRVPSPQQHIRSRAHLIAVTEVGDAYVEGNAIVGRDLRDSGLNVEKRWISVGDARVDFDCASNAAQGWISSDRPFSSGHMQPTAHPACRCDMAQRVRR